MKITKQLLTLSLCLCLMLSAVGCQPKSPFKPEETDDEVTSITIFKDDWSAFNTAREGQSEIYKKVKEAVGADIIAQSGAGATWLTQLMLRQADQDLPEIFMVEGPTTPEFFQSLIREGDVIALDDYVNDSTKSIYPNLYAHLQKFEYMKKNLSYFNDKMWFIPANWANEKSLYVRRDWIDNLNAKLDDILLADGVVSSKAQITAAMREQWKFKEPKDLLEFYRLARAFTIYDPDNNGFNDTTGYFSERNKDMDAWIYVAYGTGWNGFVYDQNEGKYVPSDITDESMYATNFITKLMAEGYMSKDSLTADNDIKQNRFIQGKVGMIYAQNWLNTFVSGMMDIYNCTIEQATDKILMCDPPMGRDGKFGGAGSNGSATYWEGFCINGRMSEARTKKCLKLFDYLLSEDGSDLMFYGLEGVHYKVENDKRVSLTPKNSKGFATGVQAHDPATLLYALTDWVGHYSVETATNGDIAAARMERSAANCFKEDYPDLQTQAAVDYREGCYDYFHTQISNMQNDTKNIFKPDWQYNALTFGWDQLYIVNKNFSSAWSTYVKNYKENYKGQLIIDEYNNYISSGKAQKVN